MYNLPPQADHRSLMGGGVQRVPDLGQARTIRRQPEIARLDNTLQPSDMPNLGYRPLGQKAIVEVTQAITKTESGLTAVGGVVKKPVFRIVRFGSEELYAESYRSMGLRLGSVVYTSNIPSTPVHHEFPKFENGDIRMLFQIDVATIEGILPGHEWTEEEVQAMKEAEAASAVGVTDSVQEAMGAMLQQEDLHLVPLEPIGDNIIIERLPNQTMQGSVYLAGGGKTLPFFRILKVSPQSSLGQGQFANLAAGSVISMVGVGEQQAIPHDLRSPVDNQHRQLYLAPVGCVTGFFPAFEPWGESQGDIAEPEPAQAPPPGAKADEDVVADASETSIDIEDGVETREDLGGSS